jgi:hypothetical protein
MELVEASTQVFVEYWLSVKQHLVELPILLTLHQLMTLWVALNILQ